MLLSLPAGRKPRVHFSGIGGTAMVAGARIALEAGWEVRGSDQPLYPPTSDMVRELGVPVATGYAAANLDWNPDVLIVGNVLSRSNPEVEAALERKLHYVSLPEWMKDVVLRARRPVVIAGTHGKTTTTALTAYILDHIGFTPGYFIGGQPLDFEHSGYLGPEGAPFVIEGDEYDTAFFDKRAKFLHYIPEIAVVTSVEFDHGDIYRDLAEIEVAFQRLLRQIPQSGWLVACADDPGAVALKDHAFSHVATYGFHKEADWRGIWNGMADEARGLQALSVLRHGEPWVELEVPLAGRHNLLNTLAAVTVAGLLGAEPAAIRDALPQFRGVKRRMEIFHEAQGITFIDDFAHHPTAIHETIAGARARWPKRRLVVLFEPRSNTTVTRKFQESFRDAFKEAHEVWLGPIYRGDRIADDERLDRDQVVRDLIAHGLRAGYAESADAIVAHLQGTATPGEVVLILSNGAFGGIYAKLRKAFPSTP